jgi:bacterioferritin-associated ferredoxin
MYVCICKGITDHQIRSAVNSGASSLGQVRNALGVASQCGKCACLAKDVINEAVAENNASFSDDMYYAAG